MSHANFRVWLVLRWGWQVDNIPDEVFLNKRSDVLELGFVISPWRSFSLILIYNKSTSKPHSLRTLLCSKKEIPDSIYRLMCSRRWIARVLKLRTAIIGSKHHYHIKSSPFHSVLWPPCFLPTPPQAATSLSLVTLLLLCAAVLASWIKDEVVVVVSNSSHCHSCDAASPFTMK